jgi:putative ABC transport system permease protein
VSTETLGNKIDNALDFYEFIKLKSGVSAEEGRAAIEPLLKAYPTAKLQDNAQYKADQKDQIQQFLIIFYVLLLFAVIVAVIGIANTLSLSVIERTREIGLLRAVGMLRRQLRSTIRWEAVIIALLGTVLGLVIGVLFAYAAVKALEEEGFKTFEAKPLQLVIIAVVFSVLAVVMAALPARRAAKLDVMNAITED